MAEADVSSSSSSSDDVESITNRDQGKQREKQLHTSLATTLYREMAPEDYMLFKHEAEVELPRGVLANCPNVIAVFEQLETEGRIRPGQYKPLYRILKRAGLKRLYTMVKDEGKKIHDVLTVAKTERRRSWGKPQERMTRRRLADQPPEPQTPTKVLKTKGKQPKTSRRRTVKSTAAIDRERVSAAPRTPSEMPVGTVHGADNIDSTQPDSEDVVKLRGKSDLFRSNCDNNTQDFVKITLYHKTRQMIEDNNSVLVLGGMGDGKSSIIQYIAAHPMDEYLQVPCTRAKEIKKYFDLVQGTGIKLLFVFDNSFGDSYKIQRNVDEWVTLGDQLAMYLTTHKLLIATRITIWKDCEKALKKFFGNVVEISSSNLTSADKRKLLEKYLEDKAVHDVVVDKIVNQIKPIAFGQCCTLVQGFLSKVSQQQQHQRSVAQKVIEIFQKPFSYLQTEVKAMADNEQTKYATLCFIMLCGGELECDVLSGTMSDVTPELRERMEDVVDVCGCKQSTCGDLQRCAENLSGTYLVKTQKPGNKSDSCEIYKFSHDSIAEAVTMNYGEFHFQHCLKYLKRDVVVNIVRPKNYEKGEQEFAIKAPTQYYGEIAGMFTQTIIDANRRWGLGGVCENPCAWCVRDEKFQSVWIDYLTKTPPEKLVPFCRNKDINDQCVLYHLAKSGANKLVRYLCEHPARQTLTLTCHCRSEDRLPCPIWGAVIGDQTETFTYLMSNKPDQRQVSRAVLAACESGSVRVLKVLVSQLHEHREWTIKAGLSTACVCGCVSTARYLLSEVCTPCKGDDHCGCVEGLLAASELGRTDIVRVILSSGHKADINKQNYAGVSVLHLSAYGLHNVTVRELVDNGADVNTADRWGQTPIHAAMMRTRTIWLRDEDRCETDEDRRHKRRDVVQTLCHQSGVTTATDQWGRTALNVAAHRGYTDLVKLFDKHGYQESRDLERQWLEPNEQDRADMERAGYRIR